MLSMLDRRRMRSGGVVLMPSSVGTGGAGAGRVSGRGPPSAGSPIAETADLRDIGRVLTRRSQITRLRRVAEAAVEQYPLADGRLRFIGHGENTTFRHDSAAGSHLVRVHRPRRHGHDMHASGAIRSEIAWLTGSATRPTCTCPRHWPAGTGR